MTATMFRLYDVSLCNSLNARNSHLEREQAIAVDDLLEYNTFVPVGHEGGPYCLRLALADASLALHVRTEQGAHVVRHNVSLTSFHRVFKDYFMICENYNRALTRPNARRIEAMDTRRRAVHDDASELLRERLAPKVTVDKNTARRLFTLIYALFVESPAASDSILVSRKIMAVQR
ncbi:UPF0262 family protein [Sinorhizobium americanum]|uniref:Uncharacterized protein (UPF0262 family) n=1 Tax=Sinorhizobium americanum TaxID=194963 RepID=A0A4R2B1Z9_9HYPH|nr:UPF0262 family protein [Sinorhizobium americanum]TCN20366.1 uncharacterized protein (UPF0262 family) [Sinorhizobium americanum]